MSRCSMVLTALLLALCLGVCARQASATNYYVTPSGSASNSGLSWAQAKTLQSAINTASPATSDKVYVAQGTYTGNFTAQDGVPVYGSYVGSGTPGSRTSTLNTSILDGNNNGTVYTIPSSATGTETLDGFKLQHGTGTETQSAGGYYTAGGGFYSTASATLSVSNCTFTNNAVQFCGGGAYTDYEGSGGGNITFSSCSFTSNTSQDGDGGGLYSHGLEITLSNSKFISNGFPSAEGFGGGASIFSSSVSITNCTFTGNNAIQGGGLLTSNTRISGSTFSSNSASSDGGGIFSSYNGDNTCTNCTFSGNNAVEGGAFWSGGNDVLTSCTFMNNIATNTGGAINEHNGTTIVSCTFTNDAAGNTSAPGQGGGVACLQDGGGSIEDSAFTGEYPQAMFLQDSAGPFLVKDNLIDGAGAASGTPDGIDVATTGVKPFNVTLGNNTIVNSQVGIDIIVAYPSEAFTNVASVGNNILSKNKTGISYPSPAPADTTLTLANNDSSANHTNYSPSTLGAAPDKSFSPGFTAYSSSPGGDYSLTSSSGCLGAGTTSYGGVTFVTASDLSLDGFTWGNPPNIGCYYK